MHSHGLGNFLDSNTAQERGRLSKGWKNDKEGERRKIEFKKIKKREGCE